MPYRAGGRLAGEKASKLGHLDVIKSDLVNELIAQFESLEPGIANFDTSWDEIVYDLEPLRLIFSVDGSKQTVRSDLPPYKELSFIKTALLRLDQQAIAKLDPEAPHPLALRDIMSEAAIYHATVFPLKGIKLHGRSNYDAVRQIIFDSLRDPSLNAEPYNTLKWLSYELWTDVERRSPGFECPTCGEEYQGLPYKSDEGKCERCGGHLFLTDLFGFHLEMGEDTAPESIATAYMLVHETLLLFTGIRYFWERNKFNVLSDSLFLKDGPLTLRGQYSKLVIPIRRFLEFAQEKGVNIFIAGQEKTGAFVDHLEIIHREAPIGSVFVPDNDYIRREIQHKPERSEAYGLRTNYGNKVFVKSDDYHHMVLSVPTGEYKDTKSIDDLIGIKRVLVTLPEILSYRHECALVPIELANGVASLSSYPSAAILKVFADV